MWQNIDGGGFVPRTRDKCSYCKDKFKSTPPLFRDSSMSGPHIPFYMSQPHRCCLQTMNAVQMAYDRRWLSPLLYSRWMSINAGMYQLGSESEELMSLWDVRKEKIVAFEPTAVAQIIDRKTMKTANELVKAVCSKPLRYDKLLVKACQRARDRNFKVGIIQFRGCRHHPDSCHVQIKGSQAAKRAKVRNNVKLLNNLFPFSSAVDKQKTNIDLASLVNMAAKANRLETVNDALRHIAVGTANVTATAMVIHALGNPVWSRMSNMMMKDKACCMSSSQYTSYFKAVSTAIRRTSRWPDKMLATLEEVTAAAYWELATGRSRNVSDWDAECEKRTQHRMYLRPPDDVREPSAATDAEYRRALRPELDKIMLKLIPREQTWREWPKFVKSRNQWLSTGSAGAKFFNVNGEQVRLFKRSYFETVRDRDMIRWLDRMPIIIARASEKFESGKARAIYGTDVVDYAIMSYVILPLESKLTRLDGLESGLSGADEVAAMFRRLWQIQSGAAECTMID